MSKEGYLLYHEGGGRRSQIYYCVLGEGYLQFYSRRDNGVLIKDVALTKSKLKIRGVPDHEARNCPFSFSVSIHPAKIVDGRQIVYGKPTSLVLSAPSWAERKSWGNTIHSWQRNYWGEPMHRLSLREDGDVEAFFEEQRSALADTLHRASMASSQGSTTPSASSAAGGSSASGGRTSRKTFFGRAPSIQTMSNSVRKKIRSASVTISLPPMTLNITSSLQHLRPQQQQQPTQPPPAVAH
jgi:hypothetical protein